MKNINELMMNPVRMRIIQELAVKESSTTSEISEKLNDVPRTTLYRHIKLLIDNKILYILSEQRIRGSIERTIALNVQEITSKNTLTNASDDAFRFLMSKYARFSGYFNGDAPNPGRDRIFLNNTMLMMNDSEFDQFTEEIRKLLIKFSLDVREDRKPRDISIISSPIEKEK